MFFSEEEAKPLLKGKMWIAFISGGFRLFSPAECDPNSQPHFFWDQKHSGLLEAGEAPGKMLFHTFSVLLLFMIFFNCSCWPLLDIRYWAWWALLSLVRMFFCLRILVYYIKMGKRPRNILSRWAVFSQSVAVLQMDPGGCWGRGRSQHLDIQIEVENVTSFNYFLFRFTT